MPTLTKTQEIIPPTRTISELLNHGIINLDKPRGPTSHQVVDYVKKILHLKKAGHSGTLDPHVTGVLPLALGKATRIVQVLLNQPKEYVGTMHLHKEIPEIELKKTIQNFFLGKIQQIPPLKSAVKRQLREREIYYFDILEIEEKDILFKIGCQAGTYIRKICHDLGQKLKIGAHLSQLRRTKVGPFNEKTLTTLHDLQDAYIFWQEDQNETELKKILLPIETAIQHLPKIWLHPHALESISHGRDLAIPGITKLNEFQKNQIIALLTPENKLLALGISLIDSKEILKKQKGLAVKTKKVFV